MTAGQHRPETNPLIPRGSARAGQIAQLRGHRAKLDRAFRNAADALAVADQWKRQGVDLIVADMGTEPVTHNGVSRMFFGMLALVAEFERERIKERIADGRKAKRATGGHIGGYAPFGFRKVGEGKAARLEPHPEQQEALATIRQLAAQGRRMRSLW